MQFEHYEYLWLLWLVPMIVLVYAWSFYRKSKLLKRFATPAMLQRINRTVSRPGQIVKAGLLVYVIIAITIALTQPLWNPHTKRNTLQGRDVVVLLDVSRSMLAEDIYPNRLERAKLWIKDLLDDIEGDRVGIVAFAGSTAIVSPLTSDYNFIQLALDDVTYATASQGGTNIGDAIRKATEEIFDKQENDFKDIILITDGDDHESFPLEAAKVAAQAGIRIFAIGIGNDKDGTPIPIIDENGRKSFLKYEGEIVKVKLNGESLREIVYATPGGRYFNVGTGTIEDFGKEYLKISQSSGKKDVETVSRLVYDQKFQIFLAIGLILLIIEVFVSERNSTVEVSK